MFGRMLCTTLSLVEKLSGKIRHKHVSVLHVIIVETLPHESMNHLCSWLAWQERIQYPAILTFMDTAGEGTEHARQTKEDRQAYSTPENPTCWCSTGSSKEPPTDMCNQPHPHVSLSLSASLANVSA